MVDDTRLAATETVRNRFQRALKQKPPRFIVVLKR